MKNTLKKYLLSLVAVLCIFSCSSCDLFMVSTVPSEEAVEVSETSVSVDIDNESEESKSEASSSLSDSDSNLEYSGSEELWASESEYESIDTTESENESELVSESYPVFESESESVLVSESYPASEPEYTSEVPIDFEGSYTTKEDVALYIYTYECLPQNFMTKNEARDLGWQGGSLEPYAEGMCIGGDRFGNYEGLLPDDREYTECDIDTLGASSRGAKRIVFSNDGLIYYTDDHYESFELLYGEE